MTSIFFSTVKAAGYRFNKKLNDWHVYVCQFLSTVKTASYRFYKKNWKTSIFMFINCQSLISWKLNDWYNYVHQLPVIKGTLSGQMTWQFLNALELFSPWKNQTIQFWFSFNLYFEQKRAPKLSICHLVMKSSFWVFDVTDRRNGFHNFQRYH